MSSARRPPVLVLGGTGHLGRHVVAALLARGEPVRVLSRDTERARRLLGAEVEIVQGDLCDPGRMAVAMAGVERAVVAVSAMAPATYRHTRRIEHDAVIAAIEHGMGAALRRVVLLSIFDFDLALAARLGLRDAQVKHDLETWLRGTALDWTVLGQPPSMEIFFAFIRGGRVMAVPGGGPPLLPSLAPQDTGTIAAMAVLRDDLGGQRLRLVGPCPLSFREAAQRIGGAWSWRVRFVHIPLFLPMIIRALLTPLAPLSERLCFVHAVLGYLRLLNRFPAVAEQIEADRQRLAVLFDHRFTTLEEEALRRRPRR